MKTKRCYKTKKELVKLRAYFQNKNLQNQCMLKDVQRIKQNKYLREYKNTNRNKDALIIDDTIEDEFICMNEVDDQVDLVLENHSGFKLIKKEKFNTLLKENNNYGKCNQNFGNHNKKINGLIKNGPEIPNNSQITSVSFGQRRTKPLSAVLNEPSDVNEPLRQEGVTNNNSLFTCNEYKNDLQSLLIMMTIHSTTDQNTESKESIHAEASAVSKVCEFCDEVIVSDSPNHNELSNEIETNELSTLLNIQPIIKEWNQRQKYLFKKYINIWKLFVNNKRENRMLQQRQETLNLFFDKLAKKKNSASSNDERDRKSYMLARDYNSYRHRYFIILYCITMRKRVIL